MRRVFWCKMHNRCFNDVERIPRSCVEVVDCWETGVIFPLFFLTFLVLCCCCFWYGVMVLVHGGVDSRWIETRGLGGPLCHHGCVAPFWPLNGDFTKNYLQNLRRTGRQTDWN
jgi:hypothetical protein